MAPEADRKRPPIGYVLTLTVIGLYLLIRAVEGAICMAAWLFDVGTCPW